jgi:hypothetical protein
MWSRHEKSASHQNIAFKSLSPDNVKKSSKKFYDTHKDRYKEYYQENKDRLKKLSSESFQRRKDSLRERSVCSVCGAEVMAYSMRGHTISKRHRDALPK